MRNFKFFPNNYFKKHTNNPFLQRITMTKHLKKEEVFIFNEEERPAFKKYNQIKEEENMSAVENLLHRKHCLLNVIKKDVVFEVKRKENKENKEKKRNQFGMFVDREYYELDLNKKD